MTQVPLPRWWVVINEVELRTITHNAEHHGDVLSRQAHDGLHTQDLLRLLGYAALDIT